MAQPNWRMAFYELAIEVMLADEENKANFGKHIGSKTLLDEATRVTQRARRTPKFVIAEGALDGQ